MQVARRSDMDMNGHINNVTYLNWALETVPADVYLNFSLQQARRHARAPPPQSRSHAPPRRAGRRARCCQGLEVWSWGKRVSQCAARSAARRWAGAVQRGRVCGFTPRRTRPTARAAQVELDYKSECMAGQTVESLGSRVVEDTNGTGVLRCAAPASALPSTLGPQYAGSVRPLLAALRARTDRWTGGRRLLLVARVVPGAVSTCAEPAASDAAGAQICALAAALRRQRLPRARARAHHLAPHLPQVLRRPRPAPCRAPAL